jgi:6-phosphogluconolactonase (cycloisomerase 2 family)
MRTRFTWIVAILALVAIGVLMACGSKYNSSNNGLVIVPTQGSAVMETFSLNLANGHISQINNAAGPPTNGLAKSVILDPAGAFAYVIVYQNPAVAASVTGIQSFQVGSDGKLSSIGTTVLQNTSITVGTNTESIPVVPVALTMDSGGKFLFVADSATSDSSIPSNPVPGSVSVLAIGSNGSLTELPSPTSTSPGSPFPLPGQTGGSNPSASALAVTPTVFPAQFSYCSGNTPPTTENLFVTDSVNYVLVNYSVDMSTGALGPPLNTTTVQSIPTGTVPSGVAIDPCNRFAYVANASPNNSVSAYTICSVASASTCPFANNTLLPVAGSPYPAGDNPGPMAIDTIGTTLYVVDTGSTVAGQISGYRISATTGALTAMTPVATGSGPNSIAIRGDDTWLFVANFNTGSLSQYAINPATGVLTPESSTTTFNQPTGVAVK